MSDRARKLLDEALDLPAEDRAMLRAELADGPGPEAAEEIEAAWAEEIERRLREVEDGTVELLDAETVLRELRAKYPRRG